MLITKNTGCTAIGVAGSVIASWFGGWSSAMTTLLIFMAADYVTGLMVAGVFHQSKKTKNGTLESRAGFKGLCKKGMILLFVLIGYRIDITLGMTYIKDAVCIAFIANELISIIENAGLMGIKVPEPLANSIDVLKKKVTKDESK